MNDAAIVSARPDAIAVANLLVYATDKEEL
jgi:hypothetical protein